MGFPIPFRGDPQQGAMKGADLLDHPEQSPHGQAQGKIAFAFRDLPLGLKAAGGTRFHSLGLLMVKFGWNYYSTANQENKPHPAQQE